MARLAIVTASTNLDRATACLDSWRETARTEPQILIVENGGETGQPYLGTVPAFRQGVDVLLADRFNQDVEVIACFHDDLEILEVGWDSRLMALFDREPRCGLVGFGGALGLGTDYLYQTPYDPMNLARILFRSNMVNAELHGVRSLVSERVACLDGFSQIGRREFWFGDRIDGRGRIMPLADRTPGDRPWTYLEQLGVIHHFYDGMLGCLAARYGWETWYLPVRCDHHGGVTAVGDAGYQQWAKTKTNEGDHGFWKDAHQIGYEEFRDVLPLRIIHGSER